MEKENVTPQKFAQVWVDSEIIDEVIDQTENIFEKIKKTELKINIPLGVLNFEYDKKSKTSKEFDSQTIYKLSEDVGVQDPLEILKKIEKQKSFIPFIAQIEGKIIFSMHLPKMVREQLKFLVNIPEIEERDREQMRKLTILPDSILQQKVLDSEINVGVNKTQYEITEKYIRKIKKFYPSIQQNMMIAVLREKPVIQMSFRGNDYLTFLILRDNTPFIHLPICFPFSSKKALPDLPEFYGKVIGIVSLSNNPILDIPTGSPFFLRSVALFIGYK